MTYKIAMKKPHCHYVDWCWYIYGTNGKKILESKSYANRTQCRNVAKKFAKKFKVPFKEIECNLPNHVCKEKRSKNVAKSSK